MANNTGTFFNINDNDGIPLVGISTDGRVMINHLYGNCLIGSTSTTGTASQRLQVTGGAYVSGNLGVGATNPSFATDIWVSGNSELGLRVYNNSSQSNASSILRLGNDLDSNAAFLRLNGSGNITSVGGTDALVLGHGLDRPLVFSNAGLERGRFNTGGNLGIGTTNPGTTLQVQGTGQFVSASSNSGTTTAAIYANTPLQTISAFFGQLTSTSGLTGNQYSSAIRFNGLNVAWGDIAYYPNQGGQGHFRFSLASTAVDTTPDAKVGVGELYSAGSVGIGITNPTSLLHVLGSNNSTPVSISAGDAATFTFSGNSSSGYSANFNINDTGLTIGHNSASRDFRLQTNSSPRLTITGSGSVGIGTALPSQLLQVGVGSSAFVVTGIGSVGIGTTNPLAKLQVSGGAVVLDNNTSSAGSNYIGFGTNNISRIVGRDNDTSLGFLAFLPSGTEAARFDRFGNLGIGTTNPTAKLSVAGNVNVSGIITAWNTTTPGTGVSGLHLGAASGTSNAGPAITFGARDSSSGATAQAGIYINSDGNYGTKMYFATTDNYATGSKVAMSIDHSGAVTINRSSLIIPNQPSFRVYQPTGAAGAIITFSATEYNIGNHMNASTGIFTAPIAGRYLFTFSILCGNPMGTYVRINFCKNGTTADATLGDTLWDGLTTYGSPGMSMIFNLAANDTIRLKTVDTKVYGTSYGSFSGCLIG